MHFIINKFFILVFCLLFSYSSNAWSKKPGCLFLSGDTFPDFVFHSDLTSAEIKYLGIPSKFDNFFGSLFRSSFTLMDVQAELMIVEFINVYCISCQAQAPVMNRVYNLIQNDEKLREKVKMFAICPGNSMPEIKKFKNKNDIPFPLIPDRKFEAYEAIGDPCGTPFILLVRKGKDQGIIYWSHIGVISSPLYFIQEAWDALNAELHTVEASARERNSMKATIVKPKPYLSTEEVEKKIHSHLRSQDIKFSRLEPAHLSNDQDIVIVKAESKGSTMLLFSKLISRNPVCDVCHAVHFILIFDENGTVVDFIHLHITKYGNIVWDSQEIKKTRNKLIGKSILKPLSFNPEVDAVSNATMSSALIFNAVERIKRDYKELKQKGYIK